MTGATIRLGAGVRELVFSEAGDRLEALVFDGERVVLEAGDAAVLAVSPGVARTLLPGLVVPDEPSTRRSPRSSRLRR